MDVLCVEDVLSFGFDLGMAECVVVQLAALVVAVRDGACEGLGCASQEEGGGVLHLEWWL